MTSHQERKAGHLSLSGNEPDYWGKELYESVVASSTHVRYLMSVFVVFLAYVIITVAATTDYMLLVPDAPVMLPVINVPVNLLAFYIFAPLTVLAIHFYFLLTVLLHARRLYAWSRQTRHYNQNLIPLSLFNYGIVFAKGTFTARMMRFIQWTIVFLGPTLLLLYIQYRFADYHNVLLTSYQGAVLVLDLFAVFLLWFRIAEPVTLRRTFDRLEMFIVWIWRRRFRPVRGVTAISALFLLAAVGLCVLVYWASHADMPRWMPDSLVPEIIAPETVIVAREPSEAIFESYLRSDTIDRTENLYAAYRKHSAGINLYQRNLDYARFIRSSLWRANLNGAQMTQTTIWWSHFSGAILDSANMYGTYIFKSWFRETSMLRTNLEYAYVGWSDFTQCKVVDARLNSIRVLHTRLDSTHVRGGSMRYAKLYNVSMQYSLIQYFQDMALSGEYMDRKEIDISYSDIAGTNFTGSVFMDIVMRKALLRQTNLTETHFVWANLDNTIFERCTLDSASFYGGNFRHVVFKGGSLRKLQAMARPSKRTGNIEPVDFTGTVFDSTDLDHAVFDGAIMDSVVFIDVQNPCTASFKGLQGLNVDSLRRAWGCRDDKQTVKENK